MKRYALYTLFAAILPSFSACSKAKEQIDPISFVDPFIGTGGHGHTFPGATRPNAMVQFSPDTHLLGWEASSGYHYPDSIVYAFSLTHLSGTGIGDLGDVALLPFSTPLDSLAAVMDKESEEARPGYYSVRLKDQEIGVALTATERVGLMEIDYPKEGERNLLLNLSHILQPNWGHKVLRNELQVLDSTTLRGTYYTQGWADDHRMSYEVQLQEPFQEIKVFAEGKELALDSLKAGLQELPADLKVYLKLAPKEGKSYVKVALSPVSPENAGLNLKTELPGWNFDQVRSESEALWRKLLGKIAIETRDTTVLRNFYTAMYHSFIAPYNYQDVNGDFRGIDKAIHQGDPKDGHYTIFSIWDTYRALHPLLSIIAPEQALRYAKSLVADYQEGTILPKWPLASNYTGCMPAYHAVSILADVVSKGLAKGEDLKLWTEAGLKTAVYREDLAEKFKGTRELDLITKHVYYKNKYGYVPADSIAESVSWGVEMAYDDWCIARLAEAAGLDSIAQEYDEKALYYRRYWDQETRLMRPVMGDGSFKSPFNPRYSAHQKSDYTEGNAYQWSFYAPHDMAGFIELMGGAKVLESNLDTLFTTSSVIEGAEQSGDITGLIGQYAHGNEPSHHIAYLYNYTTAPEKGQHMLDSILYTFYKDEPDGIIGNEDCGQMSAWYVLSALGFYQICPGIPVYTIGRPIVDKAEIQLRGGSFQIVVHNNAPTHKRVEKAVINGKDITQELFFPHSELKPQGKLEIWMK